MIEPVEFETRDEIFRLEQNGIPLFAISRRNSNLWIRCVGLFPQDRRCYAIFMIWPIDNQFLRSINGRCISVKNSREIFMDYLFEHYPDHAEWFLFHPEWLL